MKGAYKCIKFLTFFITLVLFFVFFSNDTNAITFTTEIKPTGNAWENQLVQCKFNANTWTNSSNWTCQNPPTNWDGNIWGVRTINSYPIEEGKYYQLQLILRNDTRQANIIVNPILWNFSFNSDDFDTVDIEELYQDTKEIYQICGYTYHGSTGTPTISSTNCSEFNRRYNSIYVVTLRAKRTTNVQFGLYGNASGVAVSGIDSITNNNVTNYTFGLKKIVEFETSSVETVLEEQQRKDEEDRDNMESQQSDSQDGADDSQEEAESTGTTLLSAFTAFVNALTNASPSNCRIDMDLGNLDMGNVDFCQLSPPAGFSALASVFMILFCVPLSIATARKVISLFRSFQ